MTAVDVPYTANVTVTSKDGKTTYSHPINGTYHGTLIVNLRVEKEEEPLIPTSVITSNISQPAPVTPS